MAHSAPVSPLQILTITRSELDSWFDEVAQRAAEQALAKAKVAATYPGGLVNRKTMAGLLGISVASLDRFVLPPEKKGVNLPFVRVGQHRKFNPEMVMAFWSKLQLQDAK